MTAADSHEKRSEDLLMSRDATHVKQRRIIKRTMLISFVLVLLLLALVACDRNKPQDPPTDTTGVETSEPHTHSWSEWATVKDATCTEEGLQERTCACGETEQQSIAATGHTETVDAAVDPTCTETGLTEGKHCSVCNEVLVAQEAVAALGHTEVVDAAVAPT